MHTKFLRYQVNERRYNRACKDIRENTIENTVTLRKKNNFIIKEVFRTIDKMLIYLRDL